MCNLLRIYQIFNFCIASDYEFSFVSPVNKKYDEPNENSYYDLLFTCIERPPVDINLDRKHPIYINNHQNNSNKIIISLYQLDSCYLIRFFDLADYYVYSDKILYYLHNSNDAGLVEIGFLGPVLSIWLEIKGIIAIHASGVKTQFGAAAFLSNNKGGKSGLAASFLQTGSTLITDDILAVDCRTNQIFARPSYPAMRMWPDEAEHFVCEYENLPFVHPSFNKRKIPIEKVGFGTFEATPQQLKCIYIPTRCFDGNTDVYFESLSPSKAVFALIHYSFAPRILSAMGMDLTRLSTLSTIVKSVPVRKISYPDGFEHLPVVREAILKDLQR